jgi:hypothetical protein
MTTAHDTSFDSPLVAGSFSALPQLRLTALNGDGDPVAIAASTDLRLTGPAVLQADGKTVAHFLDGAWSNAAQPSPCIQIEGPIALVWSSGEQVYAEPRVFPRLELVGLSLWGPQRTLIATFTRRSGCWIDSNGNDWRLLALKGRD